MRGTRNRSAGKQAKAEYAIWRGRRLRRHPVLRDLVRETRLSSEDLIYPLFVAAGIGRKEAIHSMPGQHRWSVDRLTAEAHDAFESGVGSVLLFGIPDDKTDDGELAADADGVVPRAIRAIKASVPDMIVMTDVCVCSYTTHGHCGVLRGERAATADGAPPVLRQRELDNDASVGLLARIAVAHARAGADVVAPSAMMDGMVKGIRLALDANGFAELPILSYAVKYASAFYGPFRDAADGAPAFGDRRSHQMDPANAREAIREATADIGEGADLIMVKPAAAYLDIVRSLRDRFPEVPLVAYNVSGEYAMLKAASERGFVDERSAALELLTCIKRAGADLIITYHAKDAVEWIRR